MLCEHYAVQIVYSDQKWDLNMKTYNINCHQISDDDLPVLKVFSINKVLTCTGQNIIQERYLNCMWHSKLNFRWPTLVQMFIQAIKLWLAILHCKSAHCQMFLNFVLYLFTMFKLTSCFHKRKRWINHSDHKRCPFGKLHDAKKFVFLQPIVMGTLNLLSYKLENIFSDHRSESHHANWQTTLKICFLTTIHGHLVSLSYKTFPDDAEFSYLLLRAVTCRLYMPLCRNHTHFFESIHVNTICMHLWCICPYCGGLNKRTNPSQKILTQTGLGLLHYVNVTTTLCLAMKGS